MLSLHNFRRALRKIPFLYGLSLRARIRDEEIPEIVCFFRKEVIVFRFGYSLLWWPRCVVEVN